MSISSSRWVLALSVMVACGGRVGDTPPSHPAPEGAGASSPPAVAEPAATAASPDPAAATTAASPDPAVAEPDEETALMMALAPDSVLAPFRDAWLPIYQLPEPERLKAACAGATDLLAKAEAIGAVAAAHDWEEAAGTMAGRLVDVVDECADGELHVRELDAIHDDFAEIISR